MNSGFTTVLLLHLKCKSIIMNPKTFTKNYTPVSLLSFRLYYEEKLAFLRFKKQTKKKTFCTEYLNLWFKTVES